MTNGTNQRSFVTRIFRNDQQSHDGDRKIFKVMTSICHRDPLIKQLFCQQTTSVMEIMIGNIGLLSA